MRQEAGVLAHRVIQSVTCTLRGLPLVSLLLPFKKGMLVCVCESERERERESNTYMHAKTCECACVHVAL